MTDPRYVLQRSRWNQFATHGRLISPEGPRFFSLELPWRNNRTGESCIPGGRVYTFARRFSPHNKCDVFTGTDKPGSWFIEGREYVNIEVANYANQLLGCIALGTDVFDMNHDGVDDVVHSRDAFNRFMAGLEGVDRIELEVINPT